MYRELGRGLLYVFTVFGDIDDDDEVGKVLATWTDDNKNNNNNIEQRESEPPFLHLNLPACITAGLPITFQDGGIRKWGRL